MKSDATNHADELAVRRSWRDETQQHLRQVAVLFRSPRFESWLGDTTSRFDWATEPLFQQIKDLFIGHLVSFDQTMVERPTYGVVLSHFAYECEAMALRIIKHDGLALTDGSELEALEDAEHYTQAIYSLLAPAVNTNYPQFAGTEGLDSIYVRSGLLAFNAYIQARMTLAHDTGHKGFETILAGLTADYIGTGNPYDILALCAEQARHSKRHSVIWMRTDRCSAFWLPTDSPNRHGLPDESASFYRIHPDEAQPELV